ncbi:MAG: hypothetical protein PHN41_04085 [Bacteroidales bacterium]|jgi:hypothetical protein|nr:hypothetical protein [Bacteroidales bacterium]MDD4703659.1 hypothetical protein [Bacteroidales bacterium]MDX9798417.1 hypothetical protein [Bacteroidales bacterium]
MKSKTILIAVLAILFSFKGFSQEQIVPHWSDIPSGVYKLVISGEVRVVIKKDRKKNHYDFGTDIKEYIASGQERNGSSFVNNGTIEITKADLGSNSQLRLFIKDQIMDIELRDGALLIYDSKISQPSMNVKINNAKLYSSKKFSINNFVIENRKGILELLKANLKSAVLNISPNSENTVGGNVSKLQIHVIQR